MENKFPHIDKELEEFDAIIYEELEATKLNITFLQRDLARTVSIIKVLLDLRQ